MDTQSAVASLQPEDGGLLVALPVGLNLVVRSAKVVFGFSLVSVEFNDSIRGSRLRLRRG